MTENVSPAASDWYEYRETCTACARPVLWMYGARAFIHVDHRTSDGHRATVTPEARAKAEAFTATYLATP